MRCSCSLHTHTQTKIKFEFGGAAINLMALIIIIGKYRKKQLLCSRLISSHFFVIPIFYPQLWKSLMSNNNGLFHLTITHTTTLFL